MTGGVQHSSPYPLGVSLVDGGVNVALYSSVATGVTFCTFAADGEEQGFRLTLADSDIWHGFVPGIAVGQEYGFRVDGPFDPAIGVRCNSAKLLLDPYARSMAGNLAWKPSWNGSNPPGSVTPDATDSAPDAPKSVVTASALDWGADQPLGYRLSDSVIYELHVKGFTEQHPDVPAAERGTYAGLAHESVVSYLSGLGITAVELLPVHQSLTNGLLTGAGLTNYWGYDTIGFFAPHVGYSSARRAGRPPGSEIDEFKAMVKTLHAAGIEVILDVVFNHSAEGNEYGPTLCFRGIDNAAYYQLVPGRLQSYDNLTGCGNTIDAASPVVRRLVIDSLRYWVEEMHVDGFRFDLGAVLASDEPASAADADPGFDKNAAFFDLLLQDPTLASVKLIAEPWTAAGNEQGQFPPRWSEWNGQYRDVMRDFWRGQVSCPRWVGARLAGSPDMYATPAPRYSLRRQPSASVNFVTCHDGFTLCDLVSYDTKHNQANITDPDSGTSDNRSWNCGAGPQDDGPTTDPSLSQLRRRQQRNFLATLLVSHGVPMLLGGDERLRTQGGNNNGWCQDDPISWLDWTGAPAVEQLRAFVATMTSLRREVAALRTPRFPDPAPPDPSEPVADTGLLWFNPDGVAQQQGDWDNGLVHAFAVMFPAPPPAPSALVLLNAYWDQVVFTLPGPPSGATAWEVRVDTTAEDGVSVSAAKVVGGATIPVGARSVVIATA
jgi:glycogen operon protein